MEVWKYGKGVLYFDYSQLTTFEKHFYSVAADLNSTITHHAKHQTSVHQGADLHSQGFP